MGKLHELLAVDGSLKAEAQRALSATKNLLTSGQVKLVGMIRTYKPYADDGQKYPDEITNLVTTVMDELGDFATTYGRWVDSSVQKEQTNTSAFAEVMLDGESFFGYELSATALLNLESKLAEIRTVIAAIQTNDPTERWTKDEQLGCYVSAPRVTIRNEKVPQSLVMYDATEQHPAQVQAYNKDVPIGEWTKILHSGMITPTDKKKMLERVDRLSRAVKKARMRANDTDVVNVHVAHTIFDYILE